MSDNPKSLASLADECAKASYETYDDGQDDYSDLFRRAAAALRAPTKSFIVDLIERLEKAVSALDGTMPSTVQTLRASIVLLSKLRFSDEQEAALAKTISAVGDALRAPTIAVTDEMVDPAIEAALATSNPIDEHIDSVAGASAAYSGPTIARLEKIEERAKEVLRKREDSTAAYILEGGTRHVGKPDARKGLTILRDGPAQPGDLDADND